MVKIYKHRYLYINIITDNIYAIKVCMRQVSSKLIVTMQLSQHILNKFSCMAHIIANRHSHNRVDILQFNDIMVIICIDNVSIIIVSMHQVWLCDVTQLWPGRNRKCFVVPLYWLDCIHQCFSQTNNQVFFLQMLSQRQHSWKYIAGVNEDRYIDL